MEEEEEEEGEAQGRARRGESAHTARPHDGGRRRQTVSGRCRSRGGLSSASETPRHAAEIFSLAAAAEKKEKDHGAGDGAETSACWARKAAAAALVDGKKESVASASSSRHPRRSFFWGGGILRHPRRRRKASEHSLVILRARPRPHPVEGVLDVHAEQLLGRLGVEVRRLRV